MLFSLSACSNISKDPIKGKFVFTSSRTGNSIDVYVSKNKKVLLIAKKAYSPKWSPDGKVVACAVEGRFNEIGKDGILIIDQNGKVKDFFETERTPVKVDWDPTGEKIYYTQPKKDKKIYDEGIFVLDLAKREHKKIYGLDTESKITGISISSIGDKILFHKSDPGIEIYLVDLKNNETKYLSRGVNPAWFPDGKHIAFTTNIDENGNQINDAYGNIYKMNVETGEREAVRVVKYLMTLGLKVSKDGKYFYYTVQGDGAGQRIVVSPIDNEKVEIPVTTPIMTSSGLSQDHDPDWYQGE